MLIAVRREWSFIDGRLELPLPSLQALSSAWSSLRLCRGRSETLLVLVTSVLREARAGRHRHVELFVDGFSGDGAAGPQQAGSPEPLEREVALWPGGPGPLATPGQTGAGPREGAGQPSG